MGLEPKWCSGEILPTSMIDILKEVKDDEQKKADKADNGDEDAMLAYYADNSLSEEPTTDNNL